MGISWVTGLAWIRLLMTVDNGTEKCASGMDKFWYGQRRMAVGFQYLLFFVCRFSFSLVEPPKHNSRMEN